MFGGYSNPLPYNAMLEYKTPPFRLLPMHYICPAGVFTTMKKNEAGHSKYILQENFPNFQWLC